MIPRIALVEDNPDSRLLVVAWLEDEYEVREYETGPAALEGIPFDPPQLILMDISLPGMDGPEVLARLRTNPSLEHIPAIALTAHAMAGDRERFLGMGFDDYLTKPILDSDVLIEAIEALLDRTP
jgi:CheY-like chemotaxis protein